MCSNSSKSSLDFPFPFAFTTWSAFFAWLCGEVECPAATSPASGYVYHYRTQRCSAPANTASSPLQCMPTHPSPHPLPNLVMLPSLYNPPLPLHVLLTHLCFPRVQPRSRSFTCRVILVANVVATGTQIVWISHVHSGANFCH